jgi:cytochrome b561
MGIKNSSMEYGSIEKVLHWLIAVCVIALLLIGFPMGNFKNEYFNDQLFMIHKSLGLTVLALTIIAVIWRAFNIRPSLGPLPLWQRKSAYVTHLVLLILLIMMPLSGWVMSVAAGYPPTYFNLFTASLPISKSKWLADNVNLVHKTLAWFVVFFVSLHILGALKHLMEGDQVLQRMLPRLKRGP